MPCPMRLFSPGTFVAAFTWKLYPNASVHWGVKSLPSSLVKFPNSSISYKGAGGVSPGGGVGGGVVCPE